MWIWPYLQKSRSACDALDEAIQYVTHNPHQMPDYLRYTPVNMDEEDKYPYDRPDLWMSIQYLPEPIKNKKFLTLKGSSAYEVQLAKNYTKLNSLKRSSKIRQLKSILRNLKGFFSFKRMSVTSLD